jgi:hypothetical protein
LVLYLQNTVGPLLKQQYPESDGIFFFLHSMEDSVLHSLTRVTASL